jgi:hypothetical protein
MKWWQKIAAGDLSGRTELKTKADRLFREFHAINNANLQISDELEVSVREVANCQKRSLASRNTTWEFGQIAPVKASLGRITRTIAVQSYLGNHKARGSWRDKPGGRWHRSR